MSPGSSAKRSDTHGRAAILMTAAAFSLSLVPVFVKAIPASSGIPLTQKLFARAFVSALVTLGVIAVRRIPLKPGNIRLIGLRSLFGIAGMLSYFTVVENLQLSEAVTINRLSPFFVLIFARIFLGERMRRAQTAAMITAFAGVALILRPVAVPVSFHSALALLSAVFAGAAYTTLRGLRKTDRPLVVVFWFSFIMSLVFLPGLLSRGVVPDGRSLVMLLCIGLFGASGQLLMTSAYRYAPGGKVAVYGYISVILSVVWQMTFFGSVPGIFVVAGALLVLCGGYINYRSAPPAYQP